MRRQQLKPKLDGASHARGDGGLGSSGRAGRDSTRIGLLISLAVNVALALLAFILSRRGATTTSPKPPPPVFAITSPAFDHGAPLPSLYRKAEQRGTDISPPLRWSGVPPGTESLVVLVLDPDAPDPESPTVTWCHWVVYDLPPPPLDGTAATTTTDGIGKGLDENIRHDNVDRPAGGGQQGLNDWNEVGYWGPAPPVGRHRYFFKLYALDIARLGLGSPEATKDSVLRAMEGHVLGRTEIVGTYERRSSHHDETDGTA